MNRNFLRLSLSAAAVLVGAGCDQLSQIGLGPPPAVSAPAEPAPAEVLADIRPHAGELYSDFSAGEGARYSPEQIGLNAADRARLWRAMANPSVGQLEGGGGAEALVFRGCAEGGCEEGASVVAIDAATGATFIAVRDAGGSEVLIPNDRVEALLRLNSPTRAWDNPAPTQTAATEMPAP
jgi:hypothetical protein